MTKIVRYIPTFLLLETTIYPIFSISDSGQKDRMRPILGASVEEIANFVKEFCLHQLNHERSFRLKTRSSVSSLGREKVEDFDCRQLSNLFEKLMALLSHNLQTADSSEVSLQALILNAWKYYNTYVRFYLLSIFQPLLLHLNELSMRGHNGSTVTRIDDLLLVSFRKVFITEQGIGSGDRDVSILGNAESEDLTGMGC